MRIYIIGIRNKEYGEEMEAKKLMNKTLKEMSMIPDKPLRKTFRNGAVWVNFANVTDSATP